MKSESGPRPSPQPSSYFHAFEFTICSLLEDSLSEEVLFTITTSKTYVSVSKDRSSQRSLSLPSKFAIIKIPITFFLSAGIYNFLDKTLNFYWSIWTVHYRSKLKQNDGCRCKSSQRHYIRHFFLLKPICQNKIQNITINAKRSVIQGNRPLDPSQFQFVPKKLRARNSEKAAALLSI